MRTRLFVASMLFGVAVLPLGVVSGLQLRRDVEQIQQTQDQILSGLGQEAARGLSQRLFRLQDNIRADAAIPAWPRRAAPDQADALWLNKVVNMVRLREPVNTTSVGVLDRAGIDIADTQAQRIGRIEASEAYYRQAASRSYPSVVGPMHSPEDGRGVLFVLAPIRADSQVVGLLRMRLEEGLLGQVLSEALADQPAMQGWCSTPTAPCGPGPIRRSRTATRCRPSSPAPRPGTWTCSGRAAGCAAPSSPCPAPSCGCWPTRTGPATTSSRAAASATG
jgi:hypothetical protein